MDLGCIDLGCVSLFDEKESVNLSVDSQTGEKSDSNNVTAKTSKNKSPRGSPPSGVNSLNRCTSQIKKPPHRKTSPLNWFPRTKIDSYLKRKIKLIQEAGGMNDTLDETLGHANPHYCRVEREKIAAREAARKVMEARKAAMVEASWCRILKAARIPNKEAEDQLQKAEKEVAEAFEAATAKGVTMYDTPDRPWKHFEIETSSIIGKGSTAHTVKASFETAFEVDKQVAAAVKTAFIRLAHCSSFNKDEFKDLLRKISENPDTQELSESDTGSEFETGLQDNDGSGSQRRQNKKKLSPQKFTGTKLVNMMLERLKCLKEEELASLATIVATCGLNAALADTENCNIVQNKASPTSVDYFVNGAMRQKQQAEPELPSLDKFLVKKLTKLEKEVQEARNARKEESSGNSVNKKQVSDGDVQDLGSVLLKHSSKLEKEVEEAKKSEKLSNLDGRKHGKSGQLKHEERELPGLDTFLVKHVSRLEREVQEAKNKRDKENVDSNKSVHKQNSKDNAIEQEDSLEKVLVKSVHRLETEKMLAESQGKESGYWGYRKHQGRKTNDAEGESLDKVLVKHVSRLEKDKVGLNGSKEVLEIKKKGTEATNSDTSVGGLDQILVKHKSKLEREKNAGSATHPSEERDSHTSSILSRRQAREKELLETWGGIGLGNSMRPHVSRLERDKAAWIKAEEDERRAALQEHQV